MQSTPLWKVYLTRAALPIGLVAAFILALRTLPSIINLSPDELAFGVECSVAGGSVETVDNGGVFCVKATKLKLAQPKTFTQLCREAGGEHRAWTEHHVRINECWSQDIVKELGARHEYTANR